MFFFNFWKKKQKRDWKVSKILNLYVLSVFQLAAMRWASRIFPFSPYYIIPETSVIDGDSFFIPSILFVYPFCIFSYLLISVFYVGDNTIHAAIFYLFRICNLYSFIIGSLFLVEKFLRMFPGFILHDVITSLTCS